MQQKLYRAFLHKNVVSKKSYLLQPLFSKILKFLAPCSCLLLANGILYSTVLCFSKKMALVEDNMNSLQGSM